MYAKYCNVPKEEIDVCPSVGWIADFADPQTVLTSRSTASSSTQRATSTGARPNSRKSTPRWTAPNGRRQAARAEAWAKIDDELVEDAAAIPFDWDKQANIEGREVDGVGDLWDVGEWDYSLTSLK